MIRLWAVLSVHSLLVRSFLEIDDLIKPDSMSVRPSVSTLSSDLDETSWTKMWVEVGEWCTTLNFSPDSCSRSRGSENCELWPHAISICSGRVQGNEWSFQYYEFTQHFLGRKRAEIFNFVPGALSRDTELLAKSDGCLAKSAGSRTFCNMHRVIL